MSSDAVATGNYEAARTWHLATQREDETLTSFEFALMHALEAFQRFSVQGSHLVGATELSFNEVVVLHVVRMQDRPKDASTIAKLLNRDDLPNVLYNLRKLVTLKLIEKVKIGSGVHFQTTEAGIAVTDRYAELRRQVLLENMGSLEGLNEQLDFATRVLQVMTGLYDAAARETALINPATLFNDAALDGTQTSQRPRKAARARK